MLKGLLLAGLISFCLPTGFAKAGDCGDEGGNGICWITSDCKEGYDCKASEGCNCVKAGGGGQTDICATTPDGIKKTQEFTTLDGDLEFIKFNYK